MWPARLPTGIPAGGYRPSTTHLARHLRPRLRHAGCCAPCDKAAGCSGASAHRTPGFHRQSPARSAPGHPTRKSKNHDGERLERSLFHPPADEPSYRFTAPGATGGARPHHATVTAMTAASLADITRGKFVGTAAHPGGPNGELVAVE